MCGIAGKVNRNGLIEASEESVFSRVQQTLFNRGPDEGGICISDSAALIHRRLSVIDVENGVQPMSYREGNREYILVYNGELYNTEELRARLIDKGHLFKEHSDTEVLLHAYIEWGGDCVNELNGIFAFAVWEKHNRRLFFARDRIGVKPFFYKADNNGFLFASEIKGILAFTDSRPVVDKNSVAEIILLGPGRTPGCGVFRGIDELKAAHCGYYDEKGLRICQYWRLREHEHTDSFSDTVEKVRYLLTDSIERQLISDVPIGTFLSGGVDSSVISSVANRVFSKSGKPLHTFSVDYKDNDKYFTASKFQPNSDDVYIQKMNDYLGESVCHHRILLDSRDVANAIYASTEARDLPGMADVDSSLLLFSREVKKVVTVALSGECADELFGGYPWYKDTDNNDFTAFPWSRNIEYRQSFIAPETGIDANYAREFVQRRINDTVDGTSDNSKKMFNLNMQWFMQTLLDRKDRMTMAEGLEVRVPFCDYRIAEYAFNIPWEIKNHRDREKGLLREAVQGLLPDDVLWRKKSPYPKTHNPIYLRIVSDMLREVLDDKNAPLLNIVRKDALETILYDDGNNSVPWYGQLMTRPQTIAYFLQLNYWLKKYDVCLNL